MPVGFVGAAEAKDALRRSGLPALSNVSEKGGPAVAAAAFEALLRIAALPDGPATLPDGPASQPDPTSHQDLTSHQDPTSHQNRTTHRDPHFPPGPHVPPAGGR